MALPSYKALLDDPKFQSASVDEQNQLNDKYWSLYDKENPGDPWAQQMRTATYGLFGTKKQLADAPPIKQRELDLQREAFNFSVNLGVADKEGMWSSPEQRLEAINAKQADFNTRKTELDKTMSLFHDPKVDEAMQPAWQALTSSASMGEVFNAPDTWSDTALKGVSYVASAGGSSERRDKARADYDKYRSTMAQDFGLTTDEVDDLVKHRLDKQPDPVSQDVAGTVHFRTDLLVRPTSEIEQAIADSKLPNSVKETARKEAPGKIALFKNGVLDRVKKDYPELAADMNWTGKVDDDYATLTGKLNKDWPEQLGGGLSAAATSRAKTFAGAPVMGPGISAIGAEQPTADEAAASVERLQKKQQAVNELSSFINADKTKIFNVDAATVGQGIYSVGESVVLGAMTGGLGNAVVSADRIAKAGKVGKALLGFSKGALNTAPVAGIYGAEQGLQTYEQALASDDPKVRENAANLAVGSAAIEFGVTTVFGGIGLGGTEDYASKLASPVLRKEAAMTIGKAWKNLAKNAGEAVVGEVPEEALITALDSVHIQQKLNPQMTDADVRKAIYDTIVSTALTTAPLGGIKAVKEGFKDFSNVTTHDRSTDELKRESDDIYKAAAQESMAEEQAAGRDATPPSAERVAELGTERTQLTERLRKSPPGSQSWLSAKERILEINDILGNKQDTTTPAGEANAPQALQLPEVPVKPTAPAGGVEAGSAPQGAGTAEAQAEGAVKNLAPWSPEGIKQRTDQELLDRKDLLTEEVKQLQGRPERKTMLDLSQEALDLVTAEIVSRQQPSVPTETPTETLPAGPAVPSTEGAAQVAPTTQTDGQNQIEGRQIVDANAKRQGQRDVLTPEAPPVSAGGAVGGEEEVTVDTDTSGKPHPALVGSDGTMKRLYHGKAAIYPNKEIKVKANNVSNLSGLGPAWFTTDEAQAKRFEAKDAGVVSPRSLDIKNPIIFESERETQRAANYLRDILDLKRKWNEKDRGVYSGPEWEKDFDTLKTFLLDNGVTKINGKPLAKLNHWDAPYLMIREVGKVYDKEWDAMFTDATSMSSDPFGKMKRLVKEAKVTLSANGIDTKGMKEGEILREALIIEGYDAVILKGTMADATANAEPADWVIPLNPEQIKFDEETTQSENPAGVVPSRGTQPQPPTTNENQKQETSGTPPVESITPQPAAEGEAEAGAALGSGQDQEVFQTLKPEDIKSVAPHLSDGEAEVSALLFNIVAPDIPKPLELRGAAPAQKMVQGELFQQDNQQGLPQARTFVQSFQGTPPKGATRALIDYAGDPLLRGGDLGDLPAHTVKDIQEADELIQNATGKRGKVRVGRLRFNDFLTKLWKRHHRGKKPGWHNFRSARDIREMGRILAFEIGHALTKDGSGVDWYRSKIDGMYRDLSKAFPELAQDGEDRFLFSVILAVTSNGQSVPDNLHDAILIYQKARGTGKLPSSAHTSRSERNAAVIKAFREVNSLIAENGWQGAKAALLEGMNVSQLQKKFGIKLAGELADHNVIGAMILGPKIGSFWGNLNGHYDSVTMDLWFTRTMNRLSGDTATVEPDAVSNAIADLKTLPGLSADVKRDIRLWEKAREKNEGWTRVPSDIREEVEFLYDYAKTVHRQYAADGFKDRSDLNKAAQKIIKAIDGGEDTPDNGTHRKWMRDVINQAQKQLRENDINITNADLQAILWFHEKDLYTRFGATSTRGERTDYEKAAAPALARAGIGRAASGVNGDVAGDAGRSSGETAGPVREQLNLFQFAGENANVPQFMRDSLDTAKAMAAAGKPSEEIRAVTGWFPGKYDGKMRWEIPDNGAKLKIGEVKKGHTLKLSAVLDHPALFAAYPQLEDVSVVFGDYPYDTSGGGYLKKGTDTEITLDTRNPGSKALSTLVHEVQHVVQDIEGFARGGNVFSIDKAPADQQESVRKLFAEVEMDRARELDFKYRNSHNAVITFADQVSDTDREYINAQATDQTDKTSTILERVGYDIWMDIEDAGSIEAAAKEAREDIAWIDRLMELSRATNDSPSKENAALLDKHLRTRGFSTSYQQAYRQVAGEIEARDIQARANMTPEQLAATAPYSSENIAPEAAIVLFQAEQPQRPGVTRGSITFAADMGKAWITLMQHANASTFPHELAHFLRRFVLADNAEARALAARRGISVEEIQNLAKWAGAREIDGVWRWSFPRLDKKGNPLRDKDGNIIYNNEAEEKFARGFERYLADGKAPIPELQELFDKFSKYLKEIYGAIVGTAIDVKISPEAKAVFDKLLAGPTVKPASQAKTQAKPAPAQATKKPATPVDEISAKREYMDALRRKYGFPQYFPGDPVTDQMVTDEAVQALDAAKAGRPSKYKVGQDLVNELEGRDKGPDAVEVALLVHEAKVLDAKLARAYGGLEGSNSDRQTNELSADIARMEEQLRVIFDMVSTAGSAAGRMLQSFKKVWDNKFDLVRMTAAYLRDKRAATGDSKATVSPEERKQIREINTRLKERKKALDDALAAKEKEIRAKEAESMVKNVARDVKDKKAPARANWKKEVRASLDTKGAAERMRARGFGVSLEQSDTGNTTLLQQDLDPETLDDLATIGAGLILDQDLKSIDDFTAAIVDAMGPEAMDYAQEIYQRAQDKIEAARKSRKIPKSPEQLLKEVDPEKELSNRMVFNMVRGYLLQDMEPDKVLKQVHQDLQEVWENISFEEVSDAFTGYGKIKYPSTEEINVQLRHLRNVERIKRQLDVVRSGQVPSKTGFQRDKADAEIRTLQKELKKAMKDAGIKTTRSNQLKSSLDAIKTRFRNELEDLQRALDTRTQLPPKKAKEEYDQETKDLKARVDQKRAEYAAIFEDKTLTEKQQLKQALAAINRSITEEEDMLAKGILSKPKRSKQVFDDPEFKAAEARLNALREARHTAQRALRPRKSAEQIALEAAIRENKKGRARDEERVRTGDTTPRTTTSRYTPNDELKAILAERAALKQILKLQRQQKARLGKPERDAARQEQRAAEAIERSLDKIEKRIQELASGVVTPPRRILPFTTPGLSAARALRDSRRRTLLEMEKALKTTKSAEQIREERMVKAANAKKLRYQEMIDKGITSKSARVSAPVTEAVDKARFEAAQVEAEWNKLRSKMLWENRTLPSKVWSRVKTGLRATGVLRLGGDLGLLRHAGVWSLSNFWRHPFKTAGALKRVVRHGMTERGAYEIYQSTAEALALAGFSDKDIRLLNPMEPPGTAGRSRSGEEITGADILDMASKLPKKYVVTLLPRMLRAIEFFNTSILNIARAETALALRGNLDLPMSDNVRKAISVAAEVSSGRGNVTSENIERAIPFLNDWVFISARWTISRIQMFFGYPLWSTKMSWDTRAKIFHEVYLKTLIGRAIMASMLAALFKPEDDETPEDFFARVFKSMGFGNPLDSSYGKLKLSNGFTLDLAQGVSPLMGVFARVTTGRTVRDGEVVDLRDEEKGRIVDSYLKNRANMVTASLIRTVVTGRAYGGERLPSLSRIYRTLEGTEEYPVDGPMLAQTAQEWFAPIIAADTVNIYKQFGPKGVVLWSAMMTGAGVQSYKAKEKTPKFY